jgi:hypothetical protein
MKYRLIDAEKTHHGVSLLARVLGGARATTPGRTVARRLARGGTKH